MVPHEPEFRGEIAVGHVLGHCGFLRRREKVGGAVEPSDRAALVVQAFRRSRADINFESGVFHQQRALGPLGVLFEESVAELDGLGQRFVKGVDRGLQMKPLIIQQVHVHMNRCFV